MLIPSYEIIMLDITRNGNRDGKTLLKNKVAPVIAASIHNVGDIII